MPKQTQLESDPLDKFFEQTLDELYTKYHCHASDRESLPITEEFISEQAFYDGLGRHFMSGGSQ